MTASSVNTGISAKKNACNNASGCVSGFVCFAGVEGNDVCTA